MSSHRWVARVAIAIAIACLCWIPPDEAKGVDAPPAVLILGDSHVQGLGPELSRSLADHATRVDYVARPGWSTARFRRRGRFRRLLRRNHRPEVVVVSLGGNDVVPSRAAYVRVLEDAVTRLRAAGARRLVWLGPPTANDPEETTRARHERNAEWQRAVLPELGVTWIDSRPHTREHHVRDGVHFTADGYRAWAGRVLPMVIDAMRAVSCTMRSDPTRCVRASTRARAWGFAPP